MKLMDRIRATWRVNRYSLRTEKTYCCWIRFFIRFHRIRHPATMAGQEVRQFLEYLAIRRRVTAATQNQALNAIVFLYRHVLEQPLGEMGTFTRAKRPQRLPVMLSHQEVMRVFEHLTGSMHLIASLMYGSGLCVSETCRLRLKDLDFSRQVITARAGKGNKDRTTLLPPSCMAPFQFHIHRAEQQLANRLESGAQPVSLPMRYTESTPIQARRLRGSGFFLHQSPVLMPRTG